MTEKTVVIEYQGNKFERTNVYRPPRANEWFWGIHTLSGEKHPLQANIDFGIGTIREILREVAK